MDDDLQILTLPYNNDLYSIYNRTNNLKILILLIFQMILVIAHWIFSVYLAFKTSPRKSTFASVDPPKDVFSSINLAVYSQLFVWILTLAIKYYLKNVYYKRLRILGYHSHNQNVSKHVRIPAAVFSTANAAILGIAIIFSQIDPKTLQIKDFIFHPIHGVTVIISGASIAVLINNLLHFLSELKFRRYRNPPDVFCLDDPSNRLTSDGLNQVTIRSSSYLEDLLENQAELIYNLKLQNSHLRELLHKSTQNASNQQTN